MNWTGEILFVVCGVLALAGAVGTVLSQNPLRAAMSLLLHIIALAGIFVTLQAHLLAALQLLVYAGAVVVLFVFVIMLLGPESTTPPGDFRGLLTRTASGAVAAIVTGGFAFTIIKAQKEWAYIPRCEDGVAECGQFGGVEGLGAELYASGVVPFELISILLTVAIVGAIAMARGRTAAEAKDARARKLEREASAAADAAHAAQLSAEVSAHGGH
jgi:NADH-quinone oxidoreductase subunit J